MGQMPSTRMRLFLRTLVLGVRATFFHIGKIKKYEFLFDVSKVSRKGHAQPSRTSLYYSLYLIFCKLDFSEVRVREGRIP